MEKSVLDFYSSIIQKVIQSSKEFLGEDKSQVLEEVRDAWRNSMSEMSGVDLNHVETASVSESRSSEVEVVQNVCLFNW